MVGVTERKNQTFGQQYMLVGEGPKGTKTDVCAKKSMARHYGILCVTWGVAGSAYARSCLNAIRAF